MSTNWDEYQIVEKRALDLFSKLGYKVYDINKPSTNVNRPQRRTEHSVVLVDNLKKAIKRINPWISENNLNKAVNRIRPSRIQAANMMEANEKIYEMLVKYISLQQDLGQGKKNQTVKYIDFENPENNEFIAINQFKVKGNENIIPDIVIFVNGLPLAVIECKNPTTCDEPEGDAINQLLRYQNIRYDDLEEGAEHLFYTNQITVAAWKDSASACTIGAPAMQYKAWKDPYPYSKEDIEEIIGNKPTLQDTLLFSMFKKERLLDLIQNFTVFEQEGNSLVKMMARYQQYRAVTKTLEKIKDAERIDNRSGTIWHTQGSGKSLSMLFLALKLKRMKELGNPTLLIVTDRRSLDKQITATFQKCGFPNPIQADSVEDLKEQITSEAGKTIMTLIHKFQEREDGKYPELTRDKNIFVMVDEAHRTQYKDLAANMRRALPNAAYIGFTGTPIDKRERSTIQTFGDYIDTYTIEQSVEDGATLPIYYEGRLPEAKVEGENLDDLFDRYFSNYSDEEKQKIKEKHVTSRDIAEVPQRIETIALDIINHYEEKIYPLKGQVVTVSREAAAIYKEKLDELNGPKSAVIMSGDDNDKKIIKKHKLDDDTQKQMIERFKDPKDELSILIVCDMLLTGFDAPVEQVMYLDKPLKEHNLLQAIARVNRRFREKNFGLVVDYYGVFDHLKEALAIFNNEDIKNAVTPVKDEKPRLERSYRKVMKFFDNINMDDLEECILAFKEEDKRIKFKRAFKQFSKSMDIVMPDPIADPYRKELKKLGKIYRAVRNHYRDDSLDIKGVGDKVKRLINEHIRTSDIKILNKPVSILDEDEFEEVIDSTKNEETKASEMEHAIKEEISVKVDENPVFYESLKERLEQLIEKRKEERLQINDYIDELRDIITQMRNVKSNAEKLGLSEKEFALYELLLDQRQPEKAAETEETNNYNTSDKDNEGNTFNDKIKELAKNLMNDLKEMTVIEWHKKEEIRKKMKRHIKITLANKEGFKDNINSTTTKIMKLARKLL